jgi:CYTH domain-containing protein
MKAIEIEKTYLLKYIPVDIKLLPYKEILDIYIPSNEKHPHLRIRKNGDKYEITKKYPIDENKIYSQIENTISITKNEYLELSQIKGKRIRKIRYEYLYKKYKSEIDLFLDDLLGLILVDFEFRNEKEFLDFKIPDFCLSDVTEENFLAGGILAGGKYSDIENKLEKFKYKRIIV